jgi:DNA modification methylase
MAIDILREKFRVGVSSSWAFPTSRSPDTYTHGYHRYPAKFVPDLVKKLIENYTKPGELVGDVFAGCGTSLVEAKLHGRRSIGVDINPVSRLITKVKTTPLDPTDLSAAVSEIERGLRRYRHSALYAKDLHERLDYWFWPKEKSKIAFLRSRVASVEDLDLRDFFLCALSNILKNTSRWLQSSTKPQIDPIKIVPDPFPVFLQQIKRMEKANRSFYEKLNKDGFLDISCEIKTADARKTGLRKSSISTLISSPPYVTSYEYADIHQLTGFLFDFISDLSSFRQNFIGTFYSRNRELETQSTIANKIVSSLSDQNEAKIAGEVAKYFNDMFDVSKEVSRIVKPGGTVCLVVGNTKLRGVTIKSAQAFAEMLTLNSFSLEKVIKRRIPFKLLPTIRDKKTGRFTSLDNQDSKQVYPCEYIIIAKKEL